MRTPKENLQSAGEILAEMGFDRSAKQGAKAAFIKYLFKQAYGVDIEPPEIYKAQAEQEQKAQQQLSFDFESPASDKPKAG